MKYPIEKVLARLVRLVTIAVLGFSIPAFAQFEVAPDHFDSNPSPAKKQALKAPVNKAKTHAAPTSGNSPRGQGHAANQTAQSNNAELSASQRPRSQAEAHAAATNAAGNPALKRKKRTSEKVLASSR